MGDIITGGGAGTSCTSTSPETVVRATQCRLLDPVPDFG